MKPIPTRRRIPIVTDLLELKQISTNPLEWCIDMVKKYGDVCYVPLPGARHYFIHDPEMLKEILVTQSGKFRKSRLYRAMKRFLGEGLLTSDYELHRQQRRLMAPTFHSQRIHEYAQTMVECAAEESSRWKNGDTINVSQAMTNIAMQVITRTMFGSHVDAARLNNIGAIIGELVELSGRMVSNPFSLICFEKDIRIPIIKKFYRMKDEVDTVINDIIASYRKSADAGRSDLLSMLLATQDEETGVAMSDEQIRDEVMTLFVAGHETTSTALSWVWYMLGTHPGIVANFYDEVANTIVNRLPTADDYESLHLTKNIFKETLRLYPPAWTIARETIEPIEINGYMFPEHSELSTVLYIMHRDKRYFDNPDEFLPERWDSEKIKDLPKYAYFPFGGGNRTCIGEGFAWMEAGMILATIASQWRLTLVPGFATTMNPVVTLRPKAGILMKVGKMA